MILKGLQDKFKLKSGKKFLKLEMAKERLRPARKPGIQAVGVIVDLDKFSNPEVFFEFIEAYNLRPNAIKIIGYKSYYDKNSPYATPVFSDKDLGWKGEIENSYALEFLSRDYDLLINYYAEENLLLNLMSLKTKARLKAGLAGVDPAYNDLILSTPIQDFKAFKGELKKYLKVLDEIS